MEDDCEGAREHILDARELEPDGMQLRLAMALAEIRCDDAAAGRRELAAFDPATEWPALQTPTSEIVEADLTTASTCLEGLCRAALGETERARELFLQAEAVPTGGVWSERASRALANLGPYRN